jgi:hypothetical protein
MNMRQSRGAEYRKGGKFQAQRTRRSVSDNIYARECELTESGNGVFEGIRAEISEKVREVYLRVASDGKALNAMLLPADLTESPNVLKLRRVRHCLAWARPLLQQSRVESVS